MHMALLALAYGDVNSGLWEYHEGKISSMQPANATRGKSLDSTEAGQRPTAVADQDLP
jgi:hypothetical protein